MTGSKNQGLINIYRHDAHKITGHSHDTAPVTFAGVRVNQPVPNGADGDVAALRRPSGDPERTVETHVISYRRLGNTNAACHVPTVQTEWL
jgi:hypothetical protein